MVVARTNHPKRRCTPPDGLRFGALSNSRRGQVLYGKFDGTAVNYNGEDHQFLRDDNILFVYAGERMEPDTIKMIRDEILVKVIKPTLENNTVTYTWYTVEHIPLCRISERIISSAGREGGTPSDESLGISHGYFSAGFIQYKFET